MKRRRDTSPAKGGHAEERRRQFERGRGLGEGRKLDLGPDPDEEAETGKEGEAPTRPQEGKPRGDEGA
ncbi:MAG TPA: hypothetical protein VF085_11455 [Solirubrobacterales bacterium]